MRLLSNYSSEVYPTQGYILTRYRVSSVIGGTRTPFGQVRFFAFLLFAWSQYPHNSVFVKISNGYPYPLDRIQTDRQTDDVGLVIVSRLASFVSETLIIVGILSHPTNTRCGGLKFVHSCQEQALSLSYGSIMAMTYSLYVR